MEQNPSNGRTSKTRSYLLYALGEILLVMIGILLALQINNWNEDRKIRASEQEILANLKSELIFNKDDLEFYINQHRKEYEAGIYVLKLFNTDVSMLPVAHLDSIMGNIEAAYTFEANDGYIKSLIASGKIDHIQNVELKSLLTSFDGRVIDATQENDEVQRVLHERLWPAIDGKINGLNRLRYYAGFSDFPPGGYTSDYTWFFKNREMEDVITNITSWKKNVVDDEQILKESILQMILLIEQELES